MPRIFIDIRRLQASFCNYYDLYDIVFDIVLFDRWAILNWCCCCCCPGADCPYNARESIYVDEMMAVYLPRFSLSV